MHDTADAQPVRDSAASVAAAAAGALPNPFPLARYRLHAEVERPFLLPDFAGSTLRGVFGHALRRALCVTGRTSCDGCPLHYQCDYPRIFEPPPPRDSQRIRSNIQPLYVLEPPPLGARALRRGDTLAFDLVLIGPALARLAVIANAWANALRLPLGKERGAARLRGITTESGQVIYDAASRRLQAHAQHVTLAPSPPTHGATLAFSTPLNLRQQGRELDAASVTLRDLIRALIRRTEEICAFQLGRPLALDVPALLQAAERLQVRHSLFDQGWERYSNRQQRSMQVAGVSGHWHLRGDLAPLWPLLQLGQWLHVGKKCSFGLGHYKLLIDEETQP